VATKAKRLSRFERARDRFTKSRAKKRIVVTNEVCPESSPKAPCRMTVTEEFRGEAYHVTGECPNGHTVERYGYAQLEEAEG
jgi:hypothetical protein